MRHRRVTRRVTSSFHPDFPSGFTPARLPSKRGKFVLAVESPRVRLVRMSVVWLLAAFSWNAAQEYQSAGDTLIFQGRKLPVLRNTGRVMAFLRSDATPFAATPAWNKAGRWWTGRARTLSKSRMLAQEITALRFPSGIRYPAAGLDTLLRADPRVAFTRPILYDPRNRVEFTATDRLTVCWRDAPAEAALPRWAQQHGLRFVGPESNTTFLFALLDPTQDPLALSAQLAQEPDLAWVEPEMLFPPRKEFIPDDSLFNQQMNLRNVDPFGDGVAGASVHADSAWNLTQGDSSITIAILDDGVQTTHPDLAANIKTGGRNYMSGTWPPGNDPNPDSASDNHGTAVAGVAAAVGNNFIGISGVAPKVKILPVKILAGNLWISTTTIAQAIRWAADTVNCPVLSDSWGLNPASNTMASAIRDASVLGRNGKGSLVFFAAGNDASDFLPAGIALSSYGIPAGSYQIGFRLQRQATGSAGEERVCIDDLGLSTSVLPSVLETFADGIPADWDSNGTPAWTLDSSDFYSGTGDQRAACSASGLANGAASELRLPLRAFNSGDLVAFMLHRSDQIGDSLLVRFYDSLGNVQKSIGIAGTIDTKVDTVSFPASADSAIAVGASSEFDFRIGYSQYNAAGTGKTVDFLAPSNGVWDWVTTTDRTGAAGYVSGDYDQAFGGTSAACPLAAGIAALVLSRDSALTRDEVLDVMRTTCDKVGGVVYSGAVDGGQNHEYGFGRLNAYQALRALPDQAPMLARLPDTAVFETATLTLTLHATDADGDAIAFDLANPPPGSSLLDSVFTWTPGYSDSGSYVLRFTASDGILADTDTVAVHVINVDRPPVLVAVPPQTVRVGTLLSFSLSVSDPDGDAVALSAVNSPAWASLQAATYSGTPAAGDTGLYRVRFVASDGMLADTDTVSIQVISAHAGLGSIRLVADSAGTDFLAMPAGPYESARLGQDSVDINILTPGWYTFAAARRGLRTVHFAVKALADSTVLRRVAMQPSIPLRFGSADTLLIDGNPFTVPDSTVAAVGDVNLDGQEDLVLFAPSGIHVLLNDDTVADRDLRFTASSQNFFPGLDPHLRSAIFVDWNFDGYPDLLATSPSGVAFVVFGSDSGFTRSQTLVTRSGETLQVWAEDWDGDGLPDLWIHSSGQGLFVYRNTGTASTPALSPSPVEVQSDSGASLTAPSAFGVPLLLDVSGDGVKDLIFADSLLAFRPLRALGAGYRDALQSRWLNVAGRGQACAACALSVWIPATGLPRLLLAEPGRPLVSCAAHLRGDLNGDLRVDAADRDLLLMHWGAQDGDADWSDAYNLWIDGASERIDVKDFSDMAQSWGLQE